MSLTLETLAGLSDFIREAPRKSERRIVAIAGAPGSGKSTLAQRLAEKLTYMGTQAQVVPMDGFHLDNRILDGLGLFTRKGAPETFDVHGFKRLVAALGSGSPVYYPLFDRTRDLSIAGAGVLSADCDTVIVEGNYLLLDAPHWRDLSDVWDVRVNLSVPLDILRQRLTARWLAQGLAPDAALARAEGNDLVNARRILDAALPCDAVFKNTGTPA
ncbi:Pantothenate kinase [Roseobacter fucihabitans]|uniref:Pantothenate kinase n=1 Tax=Roseobacter fucihabitans TaxID=1537242 RepID=A0ABZ2BRN0_9RHOB|nr:AAA family ATPase [Roseobacter litoralis]MBC6964409.1 Pantothenate kinase [Roseobacter litoralis]